MGNLAVRPNTADAPSRDTHEVSRHADRAHKFAQIWTGIWFAALSALIVASIVTTGGKLIYSLDDPYIHMALAETILQGGYGVNPNQLASPSSSILYPLFLTVPEAIGLGTWGPLILNSIAAGLSVWIILSFFWTRVVPPENGLASWFPNLMAALLIFSVSGLALPMTGMEHVLHVLVVVATLRGLAEVADGRRMPPWLIAVVILLPLLRFEGVALALLSLAAIALAGHWRWAFTGAVGVIGSLVAYAGLMSSLGLPIVPSSVLVKSDVAESAYSGTFSVFLGMAINLADSLVNERMGVVLALAAAALIVATPHRRYVLAYLRTPEAIVSLPAAIALIGHILGSRYGGFFRYEVYAVTIVVMAAIYLAGPWMRACIRDGAAAKLLGAIGLMGVLAAPYAVATAKTPLAAFRIYAQQYQMHRFATEFFQRPIGVNDLGWVSYGNKEFVLDLWGLGSERVRKLRVRGNWDAESMDRVAREAGIAYAMIYPKWFGGTVPDAWCRVADLVTPSVPKPRNVVGIYAVKDQSAPKLRKALEQFAPTLPSATTLREKACE